ncbi:hypothetical protein ACVBEH_19350 [Roseateles sp. GG27B]
MSAIAMIERANSLLMLEADKRIRTAEQLFADAAASKPTYAMERLDLELAREELAE